MALLGLVRHGQSEWNALDLWTGWTDIHLSALGQREAVEAGKLLADYQWDRVYVTDLVRSVETWEGINSVLHLDVPVIVAPALKERDYGNFTGLNKIEIEEKYGHALFEKWHRGWDYPLPHGETLKMVSERAIPYFNQEILPRLKKGENILISAHGNSLRALVKFLDQIPDDQVDLIEIPTGEVLIYQFDEPGKPNRLFILSKMGKHEIRL